MLSCESCEIFMNICFEEHPRTTASKIIVIEDISYLVKLLGSCTCTPQYCMVHRRGLQLLQRPSNREKVMQYQILSLKSKDFG